MSLCWRIDLFGGPRIISPSGESVTHFKTQKSAAMLAYLALTLPRSHPREVLAERFWPDKDPAHGRNSLSAALSSLRPVLGSALVSDKFRVGLDPNCVTCDVAEFEVKLAAGDVIGAAKLSGAEFLPGFYDDWILMERERLQARFEACSERAMERTVGKAGRLYGFSLIESAFIGREAEHEQVLQHLWSGKRLLTLKGMGGVGKTRLAHEVARHCRESFPGGVFWIGLEDQHSGDALLRRVAAALHLPLQPNMPLSEQFGRVLTPRGRTLLILDNTEQIPDAPVAIRSLLASASECVCVVTSRKKLGLRSELTLELSPLSLPAAEQLFRERAVASQLGALFPTESSGAVTELCRRLDGLPLALELAAARIATLTPQQMLDRFEERFRLLQSQTVDLPERHRTLRATIDWSFEVLRREEQQLLTQLSVFAGPFSTDDAEAVCGGMEVLEGLLVLRESSLLSSAQREDQREARFVLLESLRVYATERLAEQPELQVSTQTRHARHFLTLAEVQLAQFNTPTEAQALRRLDLLAANLREALEVAPPELAPRLALALARPLQRRGFFTEAIAPLERGLAAHRLPELVWERAGLHFDLGTYDDATRLAEEARQLYLAIGEVVGEARSENLLGQIVYKEKRWSAARALLQQASERLAPTEATLEQAIAKNNLALVELEDPDGDSERAIVLLTEALTVHRTLGDLRGVAATVTNLGNLTFAREAWETTRQHFTESLDVERTLGNVFGIARALNNLGETVQQQGESEQALRYYVAAHQLFVELRHEYAAYTESLIDALVRETVVVEERVAELRRELVGKSAEEIAQEVWP
ncbi:tetratricopeptide repeat protein [Armatimonas sp.]|uniref:AfsR/SARP family transcriptional regulator n=1 Tax=Armatimonas sp. TaxID=1872638 RepID=UPI00286C78DE|nr:tetratricopeptide repeat protein [Armatimonas sp.]